MVRRRPLLFNLLVTAALALPVVLAQGCGLESASFRGKAAEHPLRLPVKLGDWRRDCAASDLNEPAVATGYYVLGSQRIYLSARQCLQSEEIHDFNYCLIANGLMPRRLGTVLLPTANGQLAAAEIETGTKLKRLSLAWFQNDKLNAPDRWTWRAQTLMQGGGALPLCREYRIVIDRTNGPKDLETLRSFAALLYSQPL